MSEHREAVEPAGHATARQVGATPAVFVPPALVPTVGDLRAYVKGSDALPEADVELAHNSALETQAERCVVSPYTWSLRSAALRRGARKLAGMGAPLSTQDMGPLGSVPIARWDALIEEDEGPYRRAPIGGRPVEEVNPL